MSSTTNSEELISLYVGALKDAYTAKMRLLDATYRQTFAGAAERKWEDLAGLLIANQLDPFGYVQYVFDFCGEHLDGFYVSVVTSAKMVSRYKVRLPEHERKVALELELQIKHVNDRVGRGERVLDILTDFTAPVNVAVRYAMAVALQQDELAARFKPDAVCLLVFEPCLKRLLGKWLPKEKTQ